MTTANQKIFKKSFISALKDKLKTGEGLADYFEAKASYPAEAEWESTIKVELEKLKLRFRGKGESASNDTENAIAVYEAFPNLTEAQASDQRLWAYLTHVTLRGYVQARWPLAGSPEQLSSDASAKSKAIRSILWHWFASGSDRMLRRNAVARLWWAVHLTRALWERDPFFENLKSDDPYRFTKVLLSSQDIYSQVLERGFGRDNRLLITILEFLEANTDMHRNQIRFFMKELNLELSVKNLAVLGRDALRKIVFEIGSEALKSNEPEEPSEDEEAD